MDELTKEFLRAREHVTRGRNYVIGQVLEIKEHKTPKSTVSKGWFIRVDDYQRGRITLHSGKAIVEQLEVGKLYEFALKRNTVFNQPSIHSVTPIERGPEPALGAEP